jgi:anti-anti-sigma regulatory factor
MASNFQILSYKTRDSLHLKLNGDFDGTSAYELINTIKDQGNNFYQIFIDTNDLRTIYAFGRNVFQKNFGDLEKLSNLIFIGENERHLAQN